MPEPIKPKPKGEFVFEPAPQLLTPLGSYATLEVIDGGIVYARTEYYPGTDRIEPHFRITTASREHVWISAQDGHIVERGQPLEKLWRGQLWTGGRSPVTE